MGTFLLVIPDFVLAMLVVRKNSNRTIEESNELPLLLGLAPILVYIILCIIPQLGLILS